MYRSYQEKSCITKCGLIIYLHERFKYTIKLTINKSKIWEGQFINVTVGRLSKHFILVTCSYMY